MERGRKEAGKLLRPPPLSPARDASSAAARLLGALLLHTETGRNRAEVSRLQEASPDLHEIWQYDALVRFPFHGVLLNTNLNIFKKKNCSIKLVCTPSESCSRWLGVGSRIYKAEVRGVATVCRIHTEWCSAVTSSSNLRFAQVLRFSALLALQPSSLLILLFSWYLRLWNLLVY